MEIDGLLTSDIAGSKCICNQKDPNEQSRRGTDGAMEGRTELWRDGRGHGGTDGAMEGRKEPKGRRSHRGTDGVMQGRAEP